VYTSFYGFKENPFNLTPDPRYLFMSPYHEDALDHLLYGINERKGFIAITGGIGTGKTTLCRSLLNHLDDSTRTALILSPYMSETELLKTVNQEFGIETDAADQTKKGCIDRLNSFLLKTYSSGGNAVLLIDEAQNLSHTLLEQIRMLSNLETDREKLIQIVLVGQSELNEVLARPSLRQLNDRIIVRYHLKHLGPKDLRGYIDHRLTIGNGRGDLRFSGGALKKIYGYSKGNPRRINAVCDRILLIAYTEETHTISKSIAEKAVKDIVGDTKTHFSSMGLFLPRSGSFAIFLIFLVSVAGFAGWNLKDKISGLFSNKGEPGVVEAGNAPTSPLDQKEAKTDLFLDEQQSLVGLLKLFNKKHKPGNQDGAHVGIVSLKLEPACYVMFKKPFRVRITGFRSSSKVARYLLILKVKEDGAVAIDAMGRERPVSRYFLLKHWDHEVSWAYPYKSRKTNLAKGKRSPSVLKTQKLLGDLGYIVEPTGHYGELTSNAVMKFQKTFGLLPDGIVGPRTDALLYLMVD
jgi:general secretion pathway protein A